jgi:hypothetical protein
MKTTKLQTHSVLETITCDKCGVTAYAEDGSAEEFLSINRTGGYFSSFGDGATVQLDLCQGCLNETLGQWIRVGKGPLLQHLDGLQSDLHGE